MIDYKYSKVFYRDQFGRREKNALDEGETAVLL